MATDRYLAPIRDIVTAFDPEGRNRYFLFGSSVREERFHDLDLGVVGNARSRKNLGDLRDRFYESTIPRKVDVVDFDTADRKFTDYVRAHEKLVWIR